MINSNRIRPVEAVGNVSKLHGEYRMAATSGLATVLAAGTTTAGFLFCMRNPSTTKKVVLRYLQGGFITTTGFTTVQPIGMDLIVARAFTASCTGGTAIDMGSTLTNSGKLNTNQATSLFTANTCRVASTTALVAGTHVLDASPLALKTDVGSASIAVQANFPLFDARDDGSSTIRSPIVLAQDEGIIVRNTILMGAVGVGYFTFNVEWDEITV